MFEYRQVQVDDTALASYAGLFKACFPDAGHLTVDYLRWLYAENPCGHVVGMDAVVGDVLAAHYVCIPTEISLHGETVRSLLSLNTATHPDFQGKGLFTKLAELTYDIAGQNGFSSVHGVANANSTPGFLRKLGFQHVAKLDARLGLGRPSEIDWHRVQQVADFRRLWSAEQLLWRIRNPASPVKLVLADANSTALCAKTGYKGIVVWGETPTLLGNDVPHFRAPLLPKLFLGLEPRGAVKKKISMEIPDRFRPSPLNLIYRTLKGSSTIDSDAVSFSFMDFDAY